ncbi:hypothetical protein HY357_02875 [Candidatus Roizmanbacteria bacterium]|nr:hypothetical protein [Candidatus Roizmanbacteria bacterium]
MGIHKKYKKAVFLFIVFILTGVLMQFHYQAFVVFFILFFYYLTKNKNRLQASFIMMFGMILGYLPMLIFEIKNDFYNTKVLFEYIQFAKKSSDLFLIPHRYLSISLILLTIAAPLYKKLISYKKLFFLGIALLIIDLFIYLPIPKSAFGMSENWNYLMEKKAYGIIKKEGLHDFNIVNHIYDNKSVVIKYLLKLDKYNFNYDDYYHNQYLFVISSTDKIFNDPAYEINNFQPNKKIKQWRLNNTYNLYLFERIRKKSI